MTTHPDQLPIDDTIIRIHDVLTARRYRATNETAVQAHIKTALVDAHFDVVGEFRLTRRDRPDFLVDGTIAIEVKIKGSAASSVRQLARYAEHDDVAAIVFATTSRRLAASMPATLGSKPIHIMVLPGVAL